MVSQDSEEYDDRDEDEDDEDQDEEAHEEEGQTNARGGETSSHASEKLGVTQQLPSGRENKEASPSEVVSSSSPLPRR